MNIYIIVKKKKPHKQINKRLCKSIIENSINKQITNYLLINKIIN